MQDFLDLELLVLSLKRYWWIPVVGIVLAGVMGASYAYSREPVYQAKSSVIIGQTIQAINPSRSSIEIINLLGLTYSDLATREPVLQATIDALNLDVAWNQLAGRVDVEPVYETQLLEIIAEAPTPQEASAIADEIARQLISISPTGLQLEWNIENRSFIIQWMENLKLKMAEGQRKLDTLQTEWSQAVLPEQKNQLQDEISTLERLIVDWSENYASLLDLSESGFSANYLSIFETAHVDVKSANLDPTLVIQASMILGLILSLGLIFLLEYLDNSLRLTDNLEASLGLPLIGVIGRLGGRDLHENLVANQVSMSSSQEGTRIKYPQAAEDYRLLSSKIQLETKSDGTCVLITSPVPGTGSTTLTANVGLVMAQSGLSVVVIDANLRKPELHKIYQLSADGGLASILLNPNVEALIQARDVGKFSKLKMLGCEMSKLEIQKISEGDMLPSPSEMLGGSRMMRVIDMLKKYFDYVLIDSAAAAHSADAALLSRWADAVVMLAEPNKTRQEHIKEAVFNLRQSHANILGVVFNRVSPNDKKTIINRPLQSMNSRNSAGLRSDEAVGRLIYDQIRVTSNGNGSMINGHGKPDIDSEDTVVISNHSQN